MKWVRFLEWKDTEEWRREDYYLAQIASEIERGRVKDPSSVTTEKKLLKFKTAEDVVPDVETREQKAEVSKKFWFSVTGVTRPKAGKSKVRVLGPRRKKCSP